MGKKISINTALFEERINFLKNAINNVESEINKGETFEFTNITPLTEDLEELMETIKMLETYKGLFNEDIDTLKHVGESIKNQDETLAQTTEQAVHKSRGFTPLST